MASLGDVHAEVPAEIGKNLVACMVCRLLKTFDQVCGSARAARATCLLLWRLRQQRN